MASGIYPIKMFLRKKDAGKKQKKIVYYKMKPQNVLIIRVEGNKNDIIYDQNIHIITIGGKKIMPFYSYLINPWNVMLPFITYEEDYESVKDYLRKIGSSLYEEKNV
jgi:hypothetical protein